MARDVPAGLAETLLRGMLRGRGAQRAAAPIASSTTSTRLAQEDLPIRIVRDAVLFRFRSLTRLLR